MSAVQAASRGTACASGCSCGCCSGVENAVPASLVNPQGLSALQYRVGRYATFFETMVARIGQVTIDIPSVDGTGTDTLRPLAALTTREPSDPAIALLDAWAVVADVLCFYQERIANEGYLPTAVERRSLIELSRLVGYRPRPGVAASVKLAFTVAAGFAGSLPAGTRAQGTPVGGGAPQFYETSADLAADADWNALAPRLTRAQVITPGMTSPIKLQSKVKGRVRSPADFVLPPDSGILVTGADVIDSVFLDGIATQIRTGDALFFIFGSDTGADPPLQYMRIAADVEAQPDAQRTEVALGLEVPADRSAIRQVLLYMDKGRLLFAGNELVAEVVAMLGDVAANLAFAGADDRNGKPVTARQIVEPVMSRVAIKRGIAIERGFSRVAAWLTMLIRSLQWIGLGANSQLLGVGERQVELRMGDVGTVASLRPLPPGATASPLENLSALVQSLGKAPSVQPANALRLARSVTRSFGPQSDLAPRMLSILHPAVASTLYKTWATVRTAGGRVEVYAARLKVTLFAANWTGVATSTVGKDVTTSFGAVNLTTAWGASGPMRDVRLDGVYDQIKPGSWIAIRRPSLESDADPPTTTFHLVVATRSAGVSTGPAAGTTSGTGFSAKVTILTVDPPWLSELDDGDALGSTLGSASVLRETCVYAQSDAQALADEPVDADIEAGSIDLAQLVQGLEPGRWVIVSGKRTDITNAAGTTTSELAMIAGIRQGVEAPGSIAFPTLATPPFTGILYVTDANAYGDRLMVGQLSPAMVKSPKSGPAFFDGIPLPTFLNQQFADQVQLATGRFANAYVPTADERAGSFPSFDGLLVHPDTQLPYQDGQLDWATDGVFAWRVTDQAPHTVLDLAAPLAYTYDRTSVTIYGNVADATNGQTTGEVLGDGDARVDATFALSQSPLTHVSAPTASGTADTLQVRVNERLWQECDDLADAEPLDRVYVTRDDDTQHTSVLFGNGTHGARPPTGRANIKASYRYGIGQAANLPAWAISQLATHPLGAQAVTNPLPATGGADADRPDQIRANTPLAVMALDRLVSVSDYADFARTYAGIAKATSAKLSDGVETLVHLTVAGVDDIPIDTTSDLYANLLKSLRDFGDPSLDVAVALRRLRLLVIAASVVLLPDYAWEDVEPRLRAALLACFAFMARGLGQSAYLSEAIAAAQAVEGVAWLDVTLFDSVGDDIDAPHLAALADSLGLEPCVAAQLATFDTTVAGGIAPAELVVLSAALPEMLTLTLKGH